MRIPSFLEGHIANTTIAKPGADDSQRGLHCSDAARLYKQALELRQCAKNWEPDVRLIGDVKVSEIVAILNDYAKLRLQAGI